MASAAEAKAFIREIAPLIQAEAKARGYQICSAVIAQACIESNYGKSLLSAKYHNYFGLKCGKAWKGASVNMKTKEEYVPGNLVSIRDNFRCYSDMPEGVAGYYSFIGTKRYENLKTATTALEYLQRIKADGYATSSTYVSTNMGVVNKYDLTKYDQYLVGPDQSGNPYPAPTELLRHGSNGEQVKWLQWELSKQGYGLVIDGIFGSATEAAVRLFQNEHQLICDGIVGSKTIAALIE